MNFLIVGLGNKGDEYSNTRHNTGFLIIDYILGSDANWKESSKGNCLYDWFTYGKNEVEFLKPLTYMNRSGHSVKYAATGHKLKSNQIIVIHDEVDMPLGSFKIMYGRGSGGHRGVESIMSSLKTKEFTRIRVGISPVTPTGKLRKPAGEQKVLNFLMNEFKPDEIKTLKKVTKEIEMAIEEIVTSKKVIRFNNFKVPEGIPKAMNQYN